MFEDFENITAKERALFEADMLEDLKDLEVQRAYSVSPEQMRQQDVEQDLDFDSHTKAA